MTLKLCVGRHHVRCIHHVIALMVLAKQTMSVWIPINTGVFPITPLVTILQIVGLAVNLFTGTHR